MDLQLIGNKYSSHEQDDYHSDQDFDSDCVSDIEKHQVTGDYESECVSEVNIHHDAEEYDTYFEEGMTFPTRKHLKDAIQSHAIKSMRNLKLIKNERIRLVAKCDVEGCPWQINARKFPDEHTFKITSYKAKHTCCRTFKIKNLTSTYLVEHYISYFKSDPLRNLEGWRKDMIKLIGVDISWDQCYRARKKALEILNGNPAEQYKKLWDYREELLRSNPGSTIVLHNEENEDGELKFWGFYVCFDGSKRGFLSGCRKFIGLDGAHLSGPYGGVLLTAVGNDPNNKPYLVAYAVVSTESGDTWSWFLRFVKDDLQIVGEEYTIMSDKQKGLIYAVTEVFAGCEHRFCVRHLWKNMVSAGFKGDAYKEVLLKAANATSIDVYKCAMKEMEELDPKAVEWLADKPPTQWSKSHFRTASFCDMILNNHCESYNNIVLKARQQPILVMAEWIREGMIQRNQKCRDKAHLKWHDQLTPKAMKILDYNMEKVRFCRTLKVNGDHFQVSVNEFQYNVNLVDFSCTCRRWQLTGIPCSHALSAIGHMRYEPLKYVHPFYNVATYKNVYEPVIYGINGVGLWSETNFIPPLPPNLGRKAGRPKHDRRRAPDEPIKKMKNAGKRGPKLKKSRRMQNSLSCSYCKLKGHNVKTCQLKKANELDEQQEQEMIASSDFANAFADVVNFDEQQEQEEMFNLDELIIDSSNSSNIWEESSDGRLKKLPVVKNKSIIDSQIQGPSTWEQKSQHVAGIKASTPGVPGVVVGEKRFIHVSQLEDAMLKKKKH